MEPPSIDSPVETEIVSQKIPNYRKGFCVSQGMNRTQDLPYTKRKHSLSLSLSLSLSPFSLPL